MYIFIISKNINHNEIYLNGLFALYRIFIYLFFLLDGIENTQKEMATIIIEQSDGQPMENDGSYNVKGLPVEWFLEE